ncbi:MAG: hypothetical protein EOS81_05465 [Mesorhizobium sp.]|uniref:hypothetical protein n=1 Tax=Mesorhizobium sp. TaxID=1871066 RepID=UPI000FD3CCD7|nr:hypothetical protein EN759_37485 [Mesorhizobium sp. M00.F.Ca.ET.038.03.1.1]RWF04671.1 MAG: hypothetical protein EOS81_05465 [Mesorhizobium sp.]
MTPKMEAALQAALDADAAGGLCYTVAGWIDPANCWTYHGPVIVSRLVYDRGFLSEAGKRGRGPQSRRVITPAGRAYLEAKNTKHVDPRRIVT